MRRVGPTLRHVKWLCSEIKFSLHAAFSQIFTSCQKATKRLLDINAKIEANQYKKQKQSTVIQGFRGNCRVPSQEERNSCRELVSKLLAQHFLINGVFGYSTSRTETHNFGLLSPFVVCNHWKGR